MTDLDGVIDRVRDGDERAFAVLYDGLAPTVFGVATRIVGDKTVAEQVTQETFIEIWRHARRFDPERSSLEAWAAGIARRTAIDRVRSAMSSRTTRQVSGAGPAPVPSTTPRATSARRRL